MTNSPNSIVRYQVQHAIARISLNRPHKLNAISSHMIDALHQALDAAERDPQVRAVLLDGVGRAFSAGFDLDAGSGDRDYWRRELRRDLDLILRFWDCPKPTVAAVHGYCLGSAMELAVACDITVAAQGTRLGAPEVRYGSGIVCLILPWLVGPKIATELLLTGDDRFDARRAREIGLVNQVVEQQELDTVAMERARCMAANDALAVRLTKQAIHRGLDIMGLREALLEALELDVEIESTETEESRQFNEILQRDGVRSALQWRQRQLGSSK